MRWNMLPRLFTVAVPFGALLILLPAAASNIVATVGVFAPEKTDNTAFSGVNGGDFVFTNASGTTADLTAPANFYPDNVQVQVSSYPPDTYAEFRPAPAGQGFVGKVYDFALTDLSSNTAIVTSSKPIVVVLSYEETDVTGLDERTIVPYRREGDGFAWTPISGAIVNTANDTVVFSTDHFSSFALIALPPNVEAPAPAPPLPPTSGGRSGNGGGGGTGFFPTTTTTAAFSAPLVVPRPLMPFGLQRVDLNGDNRADIADLSILLYYYGRSGSVVARYDLNKDGVVDLADISILMYYWTE